MRRSRMLALLMLLSSATPVLAQTAEQRLGAVEQKLEAALAEIERLKLGGAASDTSKVLVSRHGFAPGASRIYGVSAGASLGGYGEVLFEAPDGEREDGTPSGGYPVADMLRAVFYVGYKFAPNLLFNSEVELEHAGVSDEGTAVVDPVTGEGEATLSGEVKVEFAYLDWQAHPSVGVRAGSLLVPVGLVNEQHEPPMFYGSRRPDTERLIIPTTWSAVGAGLYGQSASGLEWRAYMLEGLDATGFSAASPVRGGRQGGAEALMTHPGFAGRLDWKGTPGTLLGVSVFTGDSWQQADPAGVNLSARVTMADAHATWRWRGLELRGLYASGKLADASALSDELGLTGDERLGERFWGGYVEAAYDVAPMAWPGTSWALALYLRVEKLDTQEDVTGGAESPALEQQVIMMGLAVKPHANVVLKADREQRSNAGDTGTSRWNVALGWLF